MVKKKTQRTSSSKSRYRREAEGYYPELCPWNKNSIVFTALQNNSRSAG
jgi:hypothetical protein